MFKRSSNRARKFREIRSLWRHFSSVSRIHQFHVSQSLREISNSASSGDAPCPHRRFVHTTE